MLEKYREISLQELKNIENQILSFFSNYCQEHNIKYFLCNGTLLGAIKYKGFIPWDDDIDVCLTRRDYDFLVNTFIDTDMYVLYDATRNGAFLYPFAKLSMKNTKLVEEGTENGVDLGINIDIFPIDNAGNSKIIAKLTAILGRLLTASLQEAKLKKENKKTRVTTLLNYVIRLLSKVFTPKQLINMIVKNAKKHKKGKYLGCLVWPVYKTREIVHETVFSESDVVIFENSEYTIPVGFDEYLHSLYGDYKQDPPKEKQKTHHILQAYVLEK